MTAKHPHTPHERRPSAIDRASPTDRAFLAMDSGDIPEQFGLILRFGPGAAPDLGRARRLIAERITGNPRLRQRLVPTQWGCGGPVWVDDDRFDIAHHVTARRCAAPGDDRALLDAAMAVVATPMSRHAPLWSAVLVTGLADGGCAVVVTLHHVLSDGVGGLAVLGQLVDHGATGDAPGTPSRFPRPRPGNAALARDAAVRRLRALGHLARGWRDLRASLAAGGGLHPPRATPCSLLRRTGSRCAIVVVSWPKAALREAAHRHAASTNDALLAAVAAALHRILGSRGEWLDTLAIAVPVSGRGAADPSLGNSVSPLLVHVPTSGEVCARLQGVAAQVRAGKAAASGPPPIAVLGWLFRPLAALGLYRGYMNHQHRLHTLVSHVRGPDEPVTFGGSPVVSAIPVGMGECGNTTVHFGVFSYAGTVTITAIADPDHFPDLDVLEDGLRAELAAITAARECDAHQSG